jgi:hypothetical protein
MSRAATAGVDTDRAQRVADALTRYMTVLPEEGRAKGAPGLYTVVSDSGRSYLVDERMGTCECPDHRYRERECIHLLRVAFATGAEPIPAWANRDAVDDQLGAWTEGPRPDSKWRAEGGDD